MQNCFVVIEPANHGYKVIEAAAARGLHVVVFHANPLRAEGAYRAGLEAIGECHQIASWEAEAAMFRLMLETLAGRPVMGTYAGHESLLPLDATLREHAGLPTHGRGAYTHLLDKRWVRARLRDAGLTQLGNCDARAVLARGAWPWPGKAAYLKPATGSGSVHVSRCASVADVAEGLRQWDEQLIGFNVLQKQHLMRTGELFLEEEAAGELMSLEGFVFDGRYTPLGLTSRTLLARDNTVEMGATFPYEHPLRQAIIAKVAAMHAELGLRHGATHAELIVTEDGEIELVELNVRFGGSDLLLLIEMAFNESVGDVLVDLACGSRPGTMHGRHAGYASVQQVLAPRGSTSVAALEFDPGLVVESRMLKAVGTSLNSTDFQQDQVAAFIVRGASYPEVLERAARARSGLRFNGRSLDASDDNNVVVLR